MKNKLKLFISIFIIVQFIFNIKSIAVEPNSSQSNENIQKAIQEVIDSYYIRGNNIQYNTSKVSFFAPEQATNQNMGYIVCSGLTKNFYYELLGIKIPNWTDTLVSYSKKYLGRPEVIAYGEKDTTGKLQMKFYDSSAKTKYITKTNPTLKNDILPILKVRRYIIIQRTYICYL